MHWSSTYCGIPHSSHMQLNIAVIDGDRRVGQTQLCVTVSCCQSDKTGETVACRGPPFAQHSNWGPRLHDLEATLVALGIVTHGIWKKIRSSRSVLQDHILRMVFIEPQNKYLYSFPPKIVFLSFSSQTLWLAVHMINEDVCAYWVIPLIIGFFWPNFMVSSQYDKQRSVHILQHSFDHQSLLGGVGQENSNFGWTTLNQALTIALSGGFNGSQSSILYTKYTGWCYSKFYFVSCLFTSL